MSSKISVVINNEEYIGWKSVVVNRTLDAVCGNFNLELVSEKDTELIRTGITCKIFIDNHQVMNGFIFNRSRSKLASSTSLTISGRDITAHLVDCSAINKSGTWKNATLTKIVEDICKPYDIFVEADIDDRPFKEFSLDEGETAFGAIQRACTERGVLTVTNRFGDLQLFTIDDELRQETYDALIHGDNLLSISENTNVDDTYSEYYVKGQEKGTGSSWTKDQLELLGVAKDFNVNAYRPLIITSSDKATKKSVQERANWEAQVRAGRSISHNVSVQGFFERNSETTLVDVRQDGIGDVGDEKTSKKLWSIGIKTTLFDEQWDLNDIKVIKSVNYSFSDRGSITTMGLTDPKTFAPNPTPVVRRRESSIPESKLTKAELKKIKESEDFLKEIEEARKKFADSKVN